jgi:hypothetical protein
MNLRAVPDTLTSVTHSTKSSPIRMLSDHGHLPSISWKLIISYAWLWVPFQPLWRCYLNWLVEWLIQEYQEDWHQEGPWCWKYLVFRSQEVGGYCTEVWGGKFPSISAIYWQNNVHGWGAWGLHKASWMAENLGDGTSLVIKLFPLVMPVLLYPMYL